MNKPTTYLEGAQQMNAIEEMAHVGSWFWNLENDFRSWSAEFYRICGLPPGDAQLNKDTVLSFIHPEDRDTAVNAVKFALKNKQPYNHEKRLIRKDGSVRYVISNGKATYNAQGEPLTMFGTIHDITHLKETEALLKREKESLSQYLDAAASIFLIINTDHTIKLVNRKGCEILGYTCDEIIGKNWFQCCIPKKSKKDLARLFDQIISGKVEPPDVYENWIVTKGNKRKLIRWRNALSKNENDEVTGLISSGIDVTEQVIAEKKLQDSEEKNRAILEAIPDIMTIHDKEGIVMEAHIPEVSYLTVSKEELEGKHLRNLLPDEVGKKLKKGDKKGSSHQ
ncbi:PAS domain-containing protein [Maribacter aestuarii]|uniref:PAS domain-containing protein n=1 Tax=Maribacter aestuarii TaxID=1130723 RepID=UPI0025A50C06|nr:PAS domain S-box protein [Maribacter aestuarii]